MSDFLQVYVSSFWVWLGVTWVTAITLRWTVVGCFGGAGTIREGSMLVAIWGFAIVLFLSACTPSTATHHALHEGRDVGHAAEHVSMVNAPGTSSGGGAN